MKKLTNEQLTIRARKFNSRTEFCDKDRSAYLIAKKRGVFEDICSHMPKDLRIEKSLSYEVCLNFAKLCNGKWDFKTKYRNAYERSRRKKWLDSIASVMYKKGYWHYPKRWNYNKCKTEAAKYDSKEDFARNCWGAYLHAARHGFLDEICNHMSPKGNLYKRKIYVFEFEDRCAYIGLSFDPNIRECGHLAHKSAVSLHIKKTKSRYTLKILTDFLSIKQACEAERYYICRYKEEGWDVLNTRKGGDSLGAISKGHSKEECSNAASRCLTKKEFRVKHYILYQYAYHHKWLDEICSHMPPVGGVYPFDYFMQEMQKHDNLKDFRIKARRFYDHARKNKLLDIVRRYYNLCANLSFEEKECWKDNVKRIWIEKKCKKPDD